MSRTVTCGLILVLLGCEALVQWHGISFWRTNYGSSGPGVSIMLGILCALAWYRLGKTNLLYKPIWALVGLVLTLVLLAGPLYEVSSPLFDTARKSEHQAQLAQAQRERLEKTLATYLNNSQARAGWLPAIENAHAQLLQIEEQQVLPPALWKLWAVVMLQGLALILLQGGAAYIANNLGTLRQSQQDATSVRKSADTVRQSLQGATDKSADTVRQSPQDATDADSTVQALQQAIKQSIAEAGVSAKAWAETNNVDRRDLSSLFNHFRLKQAGKRTLSNAKINDLAQCVFNA